MFLRNVLKENEPKTRSVLSGLIGTLFEIFIFCPKIQLWFSEKIVDVLGEKLVKML